MSLYPKPEPPKLLVQEELPLQSEVRRAREFSQNYYNQGREITREWTDRWIGWERGVEDEVHKALAKDEKLTPGILYVGISFLAGSLVARNRSFPVRFLLPPTFLVASSLYFLPKTSQSIRSYYNYHENLRFPEFHKRRQESIHSSIEWSRNNSRWVKGLENKVKELTRQAIQKGEQHTGLKLGSLVEDAKPQVDRIEKKVEGGDQNR